MRITVWTRKRDQRYCREVGELPARQVPRKLLIRLGCFGGHHLLCNPPSWTYEVGLGTWREWPEKKANLGNLLWILGWKTIQYEPEPQISRVDFVDRDDAPRLVRWWLDLETCVQVVRWGYVQTDDPEYWGRRSDRDLDADDDDG